MCDKLISHLKRTLAFTLAVWEQWVFLQTLLLSLLPKCNAVGKTALMLGLEYQEQSL
jgi:hypothetical protein